ncbi:MAG: hypothetical protein JXA20_07345 [Spirochaetes bacterium]|nr:hypothetical protein [Spirochaetota bacterium]
MTIFMVLGVINMLKAKLSGAVVSIRDSGIAAEAIGINLTIYKTLPFAGTYFPKVPRADFTPLC